MEKYEKEYKDYFEQIEEDENLKYKVMEKINHEKKRETFHRTLAYSLLTAFIFVFALSFIAPVFGKSGTLPQLISGIRVESNAKQFTGIIEVSDEVIKKLEETNPSLEDVIIISVLSQDEKVDLNKVISLREEGYGWGKILNIVKPQTDVVEKIKDLSSQSKESIVKNSVKAAQNEQNQNTTNEKSIEHKNNPASQAEFEMSTVITSKEDGTVTLEDFDKQVSIAEDTKVEMEGKGRVSEDILEEGSKVKIHIKKNGDDYTATNIVVDNSKSKNNEQKTNNGKNDNVPQGNSNKNNGGNKSNKP